MRCNGGKLCCLSITYYYIPLLRENSKVPISVYYTYFPDWQELPDIYQAIFSQGNTRNTHNKLPVAIFSSREMCVICAKYNNNNH